MEGESCVTRGIIEELHSSDKRQDQLEGEKRVT